MELIAVAAALGVVLSVLAGGTLVRILDTPVRARWLPIVALAVQITLGLWAPQDGWSTAPAVGLFAGSLALVLAFALLNVHLTGMSVVAIGVGLNLVAVVANGAMPVRLPSDAGAARQQALDRSATHEPEPGGGASNLGQIILVPDPVGRGVSWGDLILGAGVADVLFHAGRRRRARRARRWRDSPLGVHPGGSGSMQGLAEHHAPEGGDDTTVGDPPSG